MKYRYYRIYPKLHSHHFQSQVSSAACHDPAVYFLKIHTALPTQQNGKHWSNLSKLLDLYNKENWLNVSVLNVGGTGSGVRTSSFFLISLKFVTRENI